jgi:hypothetical protein
MTAEVALELVQLRVVDPPWEIEPGLAVKAPVGLGWTVTVVWLLADPLKPLALSV